jgi:cytochrome c-type biogenesis protein CcsB
MRKITGLLFSPVLMAAVLVIFAVSIALATFVERDYGTETARILVYNARWFEILLFIGILNLLGRIITQKLYCWAKFPVFLLHTSFIVIIAGAAITRYTGWEGTMAIREGNSENSIITGNTALQVCSDNSASNQQVLLDVPVNDRNDALFRRKFHWEGQTYTLSGISYINNAAESIDADEQGVPMAEFFYADSLTKTRFVIAQGEVKQLGTMVFAFDSAVTNPRYMLLIAKGDTLLFRSTIPITLTNMGENSYSLLESNHDHAFIEQHVYSFKNKMLVMYKYLPKAKRVIHHDTDHQASGMDALEVEISLEDTHERYFITGRAGEAGTLQSVDIKNAHFLISYGYVIKILPFSLKLEDFILERYPGSMSPSSFESRVTLSDNIRHTVSHHRIYMNNILKYKGYRFYQSSYDPDELGTVLSVNHDQLGTTVTYTGYIILVLGFIWSLVKRNSRMSALSEHIREIKKATVVLILLLFSLIARAGDSKSAQNMVPVNVVHARHFGRLLIQDNNGRIEPVNTLSSELLRKLYRQNNYRGMNSDQVFIGMLTNSEVWQHEPIIRATNPGILKLMRTKKNNFSYSSFFNDRGYVLQTYVEEAYRKKPALRSKMDNELIRLDERINICYLIFTGELLRLFPVEGDSTHTWYNHKHIKGRINSRDSVFTENIFYIYVRDVQESLLSGNWSNPDQIAEAIGKYQTRFSGGICPSAHKISMEIFLNKLDAFSRIANYYGIVGFLLLILHFVVLFYIKLKLKIPITIGTVLIICIFIFHSVGLTIRWYVSGHAPWSNGYETLTYVAWATVLAGLLFASKMPITAGVSAFIAFLILKIAHLSWMDPQITNLAPVLKSYWLVIHVATITASYGFLIMGALMAYLNMVFIIFINRRTHLQTVIRELTITIEMSLTVGLFLLTTGIFLGAVWANESWGRYWGWDPKETWALVTLLVYAFILHMRMVPGLKSIYLFNLASLLGIGSVIMTYFGVNYYLSGLHSYAKGDPVPLPSVVCITLAVVLFTAIAACYGNKKIRI